MPQAVTSAVGDLSVELNGLASSVRTLRPDWRDQRLYYETRSEIAAGIDRVAEAVKERSPASIVRIVKVPTPVERIVIREVVRTVALRSSLLRRVRHRYPHPGRTPEQAEFIFEGR
jgi:hypothetical protein